MTRLGHVVLGAWLAGAFLAMSVAAWYLLKDRHQRFALASIRVAAVVALAASLGQILLGHASVVYVAKYQPVKFAAMEGHYRTGPADITAVGWVDQESGRVRGLAFPGLGSLLLSGNASDPVAGLNDVPTEDRPPVQSTFQSFHVMAGVGFLLTAIALVAGIAAWRGTIARQRALLWVLVLSVLGPQIANQAGWMAAEIGRQPWIVQGLMRTAAAVSPVLVSGQVLFSIVLFTLIYGGLFVVFIYLLNAKIQDGPDPIEDRGALLKLPVSLVAVLREPRTEL
jgi:cytochrome d ubiquinol oxidase subunit I